MSKRNARHPPGFYASLLNDVYDCSWSSRYLPKVKPSVMGVYEVERVLVKRIQEGRLMYFIQWKNYSPTENTWEPAEHLSEDLIAGFQSRGVDQLRVDECRERLALLFEKGLKSLLACNETITMRHDVLRLMFPDMPLDLRRTPYLVSLEELSSAGLGPYLKKYMTVTGGGCLVNTPVSFKLFIGKSAAFRDEQGHKTTCRPVEKVQVKFTKSYFAGNAM